MDVQEQETNSKTELIERTFRENFPETKVYQYNSFSIRVRIIDEQFQGKDNVEREELVLPLLRVLPEEIQSDITILLLLTTEETERSMMNVEFNYPTPSIL